MPRPTSDLVTGRPPGEALQLVQRAAAARRIRVNYIHRRSGPAVDLDRVFAASTSPRPWLLERLSRDALHQHLDEILSAVAAGRPSGFGEPATDPLYLTCTDPVRGAHCGKSGPAVARAVEALAGPRSWETLHVGGCRAAVNLVCFPGAVYYGNVRPRDVAEIVSATKERRLALPWYRGHSNAHGSADTGCRDAAPGTCDPCRMTARTQSRAS